MPHTLYHFTSHLHYHFIQSEGINRGECPVNEKTILNYPNLTADYQPQSQMWAMPDSICGKQRVRITAQIPDGDDRLISWRELTQQYGMDRKYYRILDEAGGWGARNWWVYRGTIPPEWFVAVDHLIPATEIENVMIGMAEGVQSYDELVEVLGFVKVGTRVMIDPSKLNPLLAEKLGIEALDLAVAG